MSAYQTSKGHDNTPRSGRSRHWKNPNISQDGEAALNRTSLWCSLRARSTCHGSMPSLHADGTSSNRPILVVQHASDENILYWTSRVPEMKDSSKQCQWGHYQGAFLGFFPSDIARTLKSHNHSQANMRGQGQRPTCWGNLCPMGTQDTTEFSNQVTTMVREAWTTTISQFQDAHTLSHRTSWIVFDITNTPKTHLGCTEPSRNRPLLNNSY